MQTARWKVGPHSHDRAKLPLAFLLGIGLAWAMPAKTRQTLFELYPETDPENEPETGDDGSSSMEPAEPQEPVIGLIEGSQLNHGREPGA